MTEKNENAKTDYVVQRAMTLTDGRSFKVGDSAKLTTVEAEALGSRVMSKEDFEKLTALRRKTNPMNQPVASSDQVVATHASGEQTIHKDAMEHGPYETAPKEGGQLREIDEHGRIKRPRVTTLPAGDIPTAPTIASIEAAQEGAKAAAKKAEPLPSDTDVSPESSTRVESDGDDDGKKAKAKAK